MNSNTPPELKTVFNVVWIKKNVSDISNKIKEMELNGVSNPFDFELNIMESYPEFYQSHPFLVKKLCKRDNLTMLYKMLEQLDQVETGQKSLAGVELRLGEELANEFVYPVINKK